MNVRGSRRTKLKICGSKYSMFTIFYIVIFMHNKSNSYQCLNNKSSYLQAQFDCFLLILTYALLVDKGTDDAINVCFCFFVMYYKADRSYVFVHLFSYNRSQKNSKCGKNISDTIAEKFTDSVTHSGNGLCEYFFCFYHILMLPVICSRQENTQV